MIKIFISILFAINVFSAQSATSEYSLSSINVKEDGSIVVSFVESAPYYKAQKKFNPCFQKALKTKSKVKVKYNFNTFKIESCSVIE